MPIDSSMMDIYTNAQAKTAPQAIFAALQAGKKGDLNKEQIQKAAEDFESVFLGQMLQGMFPDDQEADALLGNSEGDEIFRGMMVDEYAKQISKSGGIGIAGYIQRELLGQQEFQPGKKNNLKLLKLDEVAEATNTNHSSLNEEKARKVEDSVEPYQALTPALSLREREIKDIFEGGNSL